MPIRIHNHVKIIPTDFLFTVILFLIVTYWLSGSENAMIVDYDVVSHNGMYIGYQRAFLNSNATLSSLPLSCVIPVEKSRNVLKVLERAKFETPFAARVQWTNLNGICEFINSNSNSLASKCLVFFYIFSCVVGIRYLLRWAKAVKIELPLYVDENDKIHSI